MTAIDVNAMDADDIVLALMETPQPEDPYPLYHRLREIAPNHPSIMGMRFLSRYDDCVELLRSPSFHMAVAEVMAKSDERYEHSAWLQAVGDMLIFANPPQHPRIRSVLSRAFTPRVVERLRPRISELVDGHLDRCAQLGTFDLVAELAGVLPSQVICEMLGVPPEDQPEVERWTADIAATVTPVLTDEILAAADKTTLEFHAYLRGLCRDRRAQPRDDLLTAMVQAEDHGEDGRLSDEELVSFAVTLLGAGTETTTNLIGVGTLALLQNPAELARLRGDPGLIGPAVEELLRFESPVQMAFVRVATEDTTLGGEEVVENELVCGLIGAANHDPAVFPDPGDLRIDRPPGERAHMAFGQGVHYCMGAALARAEGEIALRSLLVDRFPGLTLAGPAPSWRSAFTLRGVESLWVSTGA
ncbi:MAG TPA: cytochrome P450 [Acidimicrobiia bacterium]|nr:cytochrome P450 [Acidimicrobiia bacterium]